MIYYCIQKNPKDSTEKLLKTIYLYNKVEGYKINTQNLCMAFSYTNNEKENKRY